MKQKVTVTFTETVTRTRDFVIDVADGVDLQELDEYDVHELLNEQNAWDQLSKEDWLAGDIESREIDETTWFAFHDDNAVRPDGPETLEGGLIGQQPY